MAESSSTSERSRSPSPARTAAGPKSCRTFVWLRQRRKAIPRGKPWDQLNREGRVKEIEFRKTSTERQMRDLVRENFTELGEADFSRIRLYKSCSRGSVLKRVGKNIPDASTLLHKFSGGSSKRVYILLKSDDNGGGPSSRPGPSDTMPPVHGNTAVSPTLPRPRDGFTTRQYITTLAQSGNQDTKNDSTVSPRNDTLQAGAQTPISPLHTSHSDSNSVVQLTIEDDADLLTSPFEESVIVLDTNQALQDNNSSAAKAVERTQSSTNSRSLSTTGVFGTPFYSEGNKVGTVAGDMSPHGLGEESSLPSRTNEVVRCEGRLLASCTGENTSLPGFLVHSFDELCWQARALTMAVCIVLLNPRRENAAVRDGIVRALRWISGQIQAKSVLFWPAETSSADGRRVCNMFGARYTNDAILIIVPGHSCFLPTLLEHTEDGHITATNIEDRLATALEKATETLNVLSIQREKLESFRRDRADQEEDLLREQQKERSDREEREEKEKEKEEENHNKEEQNKEEDNDKQEKDARSARKARLNVEPVLGNNIRIRSQNGIRQRRFKTGAHFQEVYDWVGTDESFPPYFTLHRGTALVSHEETIDADETLDVTEREEGEMESFFHNKVSFKGNFSYQESLEETLEDPVTSRAEKEDESDEEKEKEGNLGEKRKRKRNKDPKRTTAKRLKKKKENNL